MEGIQIVVQPKPRFPTVGERREAAITRVTDKDIARRVNKLKTDADVAMHKIDKALAPRSDTGRAARIEARSTGIQCSKHVGRVLSVQ